MTLCDPTTPRFLSHRVRPCGPDIASRLVRDGVRIPRPVSCPRRRISRSGCLAAVRGVTYPLAKGPPGHLKTGGSFAFLGTLRTRIVECPELNHANPTCQVGHVESLRRASRPLHFLV